MKYSILLTLLFFYIACISGYSAQLSKQETENDFGAIDSLFALSKSFIAIDNEIALLYADKGYNQLKEVSYEKGMITYFLIKARIAYYDDNYDLAFQLFDSIQPLLNFENASNELAQFYSQKAMVHGCLGNYEECAGLTLKAIEVNQQLNDYSKIALGYSFMGFLYLDQNDMEMADSYLQKAKQTIEKTSDDLSKAKIIGNIGRLEELKGNNQKAFNYYKQSNALFNKKGDLRGMATGLKRIAKIKIKQKDYNKAVEHLLEAESIYQKLDEKYGLTSVYLQLSRVKCKAGNHEEAINYAGQALQLSKQINSKPLVAKSYSCLSEAFEKVDKPAKALEAFKEFEKINTELNSWQNNKKIVSLEHETQMLAKEKDIEILNQKNRIKTLQVYILIPFSLLLIFGTLGIILMLRMKNRNLQQNHEILEEKNRLADVEYELQKQTQKALENELELKNKELATKVLSILRMNEALRDISMKINNLNSGKTQSGKKQLRDILKEIQLATRSNIWDEFDMAFNQVYNSFYDKLLQICPNLSATEIKLAALLKLNLSTKEIAAISFKSENAIKTTRSRLRTKLNIPRDENLIAFLLKL